MSSIRYNLATKEIEIEGPESFIEANFSRIQDLLIEGFGISKSEKIRKPKIDEGPVLIITGEESEIIWAIKPPEASKASEELKADAAEIPEVPIERKVQRPPVRKYIRKDDRLNNRDKIDNLIKKIPEKISIASLKEKLGLTEQQIEVVLREAEKQGKIRKEMDGSYVWCYD
jgi:hypothetical protein